MATPDAELLALFNRVIGTLVRLAVPRGNNPWIDSGRPHTPPTPCPKPVLVPTHPPEP
jgi:hypothetical protein